MYVIAGLGNPGRRYEHTRHNAGFDALDILSDMWGIPIKKSRCRALIGEGTARGERVVLAKPQTYMNDSGMSVVELLHWYKPPLDKLVVVYDDVDLPPGSVRIRGQGSAGTHNGMRSIIRLTGESAFPRVRVGIGKPPDPRFDLKDFVLTGYRRDELAPMFDALKRAARGVDLIVREGVDRAMREINTRNPEKPDEEKPTQPND